MAQKKSKMSESVVKDATLAESDLPWQILLELQGMNRTLCSIHSTLKELSYQVDPDWLEK